MSALQFDWQAGSYNTYMDDYKFRQMMAPDEIGGPGKGPQMQRQASFAQSINKILILGGATVGQHFANMSSTTLRFSKHSGSGLG